ncbi:Ig-like domain-containing protein [Nocardioides litoris]|uniref:Ig-like domain-containing protein n=1 Tax=Nocardioides litoris TaxID=1926648 RepID=UPI00111EA975|nr:Ig-like domain-containing protein [Nocardioides litoris]
MNPLARRATTALTSLAVAAAGAVALGAAPAQAAPVAVTDATFTWDLNNEATAGAFAPGTWNLMSAGLVGDPGAGGQTLADGGATWSNGKPAGWSATAGDVTVEDLQPDGSWATATFAGTRTNRSGVPASPFTGARGETRLAFGGGTGTVDAATDSGTITWDGDATMLFYSGMTFFSLSDPVLSLTDGSGTVTATVSGYATSQDDSSEWQALTPVRVPVAAVSGVDVGEQGLTATPAYREVVYTAPAGGSPQSTTSAAWGAFPQAFVDFQQQVGQGPYWYSTGGSADARKVANPFTVAFQPAPPAPVRATSTVSVSAPAVRHGQRAVAVVTVASEGSTAGTVTLRSGSTALGAPVALTDGRAVVDLGRPAARRHPLTATFSGNDDTAGSTASTVLVVSRAVTSTTARVGALPTRRKAGRLVVTVASPTTTPTGRVTVVVRGGGKVVKRATPALRAGRAVIRLPKTAPRTYRAVVTYSGSTDVSGSRRTTTYRVRR